MQTGRRFGSDNGRQRTARATAGWLGRERRPCHAASNSIPRLQLIPQPRRARRQITLHELSTGARTGDRLWTCRRARARLDNPTCCPHPHHALASLADYQDSDSAGYAVRRAYEAAWSRLASACAWAARSEIKPRATNNQPQNVMPPVGAATRMKNSVVHGRKTSQRGVERLLANGRLPSLQVGRRRLIPVQALNRLLAEGLDDSEREPRPLRRPA